MITGSNSFMSDSEIKANKTKPIKRLKHLLTTGNIWLYVLSIIKRNGKAYAYALDEEMERLFFFRPSKVMIYLVLYRLESEGLITAEMEERRKYYKMTANGENTLKAAKTYLSSLSKEL